MLGRGVAGWRVRVTPEQAPPPPQRDWLLVFVGAEPQGMRDGAAGAAAAGFERTALLDGGLQAFGQAALQQVVITHSACMPHITVRPCHYSGRFSIYIHIYSYRPAACIICQWKGRLSCQCLGRQGYGWGNFPWEQADLRYIGRDALGGLLGLVGERGGRLEGSRVLDIRRHDERTLYGSIPGAARLGSPD